MHKHIRVWLCVCVFLCLCEFKCHLAAREFNYCSWSTLQNVVFFGVVGGQEKKSRGRCQSCHPPGQQVDVNWVANAKRDDDIKS